MKTSLKGHPLPEDYMEAVRLFNEGKNKFTHCIQCKRHLGTPDAASTSGGWRETQITGTCEPCFDKLFEDSAV